MAKSKKGKTPFPVDKKKLQDVIDEVEKNGPLLNRSALQQKVAEVYNETYNPPKKLTASVVYLRIKEFNLPCKTTVGRGIPIDKKQFVNAIKEAEKDGALANRSVLHNTVAEIYNKNTKNEITPAVVGLRIKEFGISVITPVGKKSLSAMTDEQKKAMAEARKGGVRVSRADKFANNPELLKGLKQLEKELPDRFKPLVKRITKGSMREAVKTNCIVCCGADDGVVQLIRECDITHCPLWAFRPYQKKTIVEASE